MVSDRVRAELLRRIGLADVLTPAKLVLVGRRFFGQMRDGRLWVPDSALCGVRHRAGARRKSAATLAAQLRPAQGDVGSALTQFQIEVNASPILSRT